MVKREDIVVGAVLLRSSLFKAEVLEITNDGVNEKARLQWFKRDSGSDYSPWKKDNTNHWKISDIMSDMTMLEILNEFSKSKKAEKGTQMVYDVSFTVILFKTMPDETKVKVPRTEVVKDVVADSDMSAVAIAARRIGEDELDDNLMAVATVAFRKF